MKGTLFNKPLELTLDIAGESWPQGQLVKGSFSIKNHGKEQIDLSGYGVNLVYTEAKKLKSKDLKGIQSITHKNFGNDIKLAPGERIDLPWEFALDIVTIQRDF